MTWLNKIPDRVRQILLIVLLGGAAGLAAVAFMLGMNWLYGAIWHNLARCSFPVFLAGGFGVITLASLIVGWLLGSFAKTAAGSGIPQLKAAYRNDFGLIQFRPVVVKFIAGIISIAGGNSLGREGPTVYVSAGVASNLAGWLGIPRSRRRFATVAGAAAGLAAAFNTPLAAITFVLEEVIGDMNSRLLGNVVLASVTGAFIVYALIGQQPAFAMPLIESSSWSVYLLVPVVAALAALAGALFQKGTLNLRGAVRQSRIPAWFQPVLGGWVTFALAAVVFAYTGRLAVLGLGYEDLSQALINTIDWRVAGVLLGAKLLATIAGYGFGGCGGIFSPTLFLGGMAGFFVAGLSAQVLALSVDDQLLLAAVGMSACFGAAVRAPITAILMIFEMTHQFALIPALMIGTLVSQSIARAFNRQNFYESILLQDGHRSNQLKAPTDLAAWQQLPVSAVVNSNPVMLRSLAPADLKAVLAKFPYQCFPVELADGRKGIVTRREIGHALARGVPPAIEPTGFCQPEQTLKEIEPLIINSTTGMMLVTDREGGSVQGLFTLHDLIRIQTALLE